MHPGVVPGAKQGLRVGCCQAAVGWAGSLSCLVLLTPGVYGKGMCLPTAHSSAADTRLFPLASPFHVISLHICFINYSRSS